MPQPLQLPRLLWVQVPTTPPTPTARGGRGRGIPVLPSLLLALAGAVPEHLAFPSASDALEVTLPSKNSPPCLLFAIIKEKKKNKTQKTQGFPTHVVLVMLARQGPKPLAPTAGETQGRCTHYCVYLLLTFKDIKCSLFLHEPWPALGLLFVYPNTGAFCPSVTLCGSLGHGLCHRVIVT